MKLTKEQIIAHTVGFVNVKDGADGIGFTKCSDKTVKAWYGYSDTLGERALTTTGIRLDFHTDSRSFKAEISGEKFELLIDGRICKKYAKDETVDVTLPEGDTRVTLAFPSHSVGVLKSVTIDDGAYVKAHEYAAKILFIGDSITQGWNSAYDTMSYAWQVTRMLDAKSVINGVGGGFFAADIFDTSDFDPETVVIAYGTNDFSRYKTYDEYRKNAHEFMDLVKDAYGDKRIICVTPIWREDENTVKTIGDFHSCRKIVEDEAKSHGFTVVDGYAIVPHNMDFFADALHPNDLGFTEYAKNLVNVIRNY